MAEIPVIENRKFKKDYQGYQAEVDLLNAEKKELIAEKVVLTNRVKELWTESETSKATALKVSSEMEQLKKDLNQQNEIVRDNLAKKNAEIDQLKAMKLQNEIILKENGVLSAQLDVVKNDLLISRQRYEALKSIEKGLNTDISHLKGSIQDLKTDNDNLKADSETLKSQNELLMSCEYELNSIKDKGKKRNNNLILFISALAFIANLKHLLAGYLAFLPLHAKTGKPWIDFSLAFLAFLSLDGAIMLFIQHKKNVLAGLYTAGTIALTLISLLWIDIRGCQIAFGVISCIMISGIIYAFSNLKNE